jgi:hypothetical protein
MFRKLIFVFPFAFSFLAQSQEFKSIRKIKTQDFNGVSVPSELEFDYASKGDSLYFKFTLFNVPNEESIPSLSYHWAKSDLGNQLTATGYANNECYSFQNIQPQTDIKIKDVAMLNAKLFNQTLNVSKFEFSRFKAGQSYITFDKKGKTFAPVGSDYGCFEPQLDIKIESPLKFSKCSQVYSKSAQTVVWKINMHKKGLIFITVPGMYAFRWMIFLHTADKSFYTSASGFAPVNDKIISVKDFHFHRFDQVITYDAAEISAQDLSKFGNQFNVAVTSSGLFIYGIYGKILDIKDGAENDMLHIFYYPEKVTFSEFKIRNHKVKKLEMQSMNSARFPDHSVYFYLFDRSVGSKYKPGSGTYGIENQVIELSNNKTAVVVYDFEPDNADETSDDCADCISEAIAIYEWPENPKTSLNMLANVNMMFARKQKASVIIKNQKPVVWEGVHDLKLEWIKMGKRFKIKLYDASSKLVNEQEFEIPQP